MCGIGGIAGFPGVPARQVRQHLEAMNAAMAHRGPDDAQTRVLAEIGGGLAACRLSLVDVENGRQPVANEDETVFAVLNGEIYNHAALRTELRQAGHEFKSACDTEVLVHLYEEYGEHFLARLDGMFGLAIVDTRLRAVLIARDRMGMKPLYYAEPRGGFVFGSEIKAVLGCGRFVSPIPDWEAIDTALAAQYLPAPLTGFVGIRKVAAGEVIRFADGRIESRRYWTFRYPAEPSSLSVEDAAQELEQRLSAAVASHLAADVPVGLYLSGGTDSNLIAALAAKQVGGRLSSFSIVFPDDPSLDERRYSRAMAQAIGSRHFEVEYRASMLPELLPSVVEHLEEPATTAPAALEFLLSRMAGKRVKAVLSGEGADELFAGYWWYRRDRYYKWRGRVPDVVRPAMCWAAKRTHDIRWSRLLRFLGAPSNTAADVEWQRLFMPAERRRLAPECVGHDLEPLHSPCDAGHVHRLLANDLTRRLPDGILLINDRQSMAHSLEVRMPFLANAVVDFAASLPERYKLRDGREKFLLSKLAHLVPPDLRGRRKHGLRYPKASLFQGPLLDLARYWLRSRPAQKLLDHAAAGHGEAVRKVWTLLFLELWLHRFFGRAHREEASERLLATGGRA